MLGHDTEIDSCLDDSFSCCYGSFIFLVSFLSQFLLIEVFRYSPEVNFQRTLRSSLYPNNPVSQDSRASLSGNLSESAATDASGPESLTEIVDSVVQTPVLEETGDVSVDSQGGVDQNLGSYAASLHWKSSRDTVARRLKYWEHARTPSRKLVLMFFGLNLV